MKKLIITLFAVLTIVLGYAQKSEESLEGDLIAITQAAKTVTISSSSGHAYKYKTEELLNYLDCSALLKLAKTYKDKGYKVITSNYNYGGTSNFYILLEKIEPKK